MKKIKGLEKVFSLVLICSIIFTPIKFANADANSTDTKLENFTGYISADELNEIGEMVTSKSLEDNVLPTTTPSITQSSYENESADISFKSVTEDEMAEYDLSGLVYSKTETQVSEPKFMTRASYEERELTSTELAISNGQVVVTITRKCKVWYYTDGKVHLYSRSITKSTTSEYSPTTITLGRIVNTDGSLSYTSGDQVKISNGTTYYTEALEFSVTPSGYTFSHTRLD